MPTDGNFLQARDTAKGNRTFYKHDLQTTGTYTTIP